MRVRDFFRYVALAIFLIVSDAFFRYGLISLTASRTLTPFAELLLLRALPLALAWGIGLGLFVLPFRKRAP